MTIDDHRHMMQLCLAAFGSAWGFNMKQSSPQFVEGSLEPRFAKQGRPGELSVGSGITSRGVLKKACHQLSQDHRMLAVTMHIGEEAGQRATVAREKLDT